MFDSDRSGALSFYNFSDQGTPDDGAEKILEFIKNNPR